MALPPSRYMLLIDLIGIPSNFLDEVPAEAAFVVIFPLVIVIFGVIAKLFLPRS